MTVAYDRRGSAAVLTIDRPARRNAVDGPTAEALRAGFDRFCADADALVLIVTGAGTEAFCAGADLTALDTLRPRLDDPGGPLGFTRLRSPKPTVAAVEGWCVAGGLELALWCDVRIAGASARFGCTERRFGVPLIDGGTQRLPRVVGEARALDLVLTGRVVDATEAERIGLVTDVVEPGGALTAALAYAEHLASVPRATLLADRDALLDGASLPLAEGLAREATNGPALMGEAAAGVGRFGRGEGRGGAGLAS